MKKLLNILNAITLIGTASTSIIGCGEKSPISYIENDISNKITNPIEVGKLDDNTKADFLTKLQIKLMTMTNLTTITPNDYDIYKAGTTVEIQDSDITKGTSLKIKIVAKGNKFKGNQDNITANYTKDTRSELYDVIVNTYLGSFYIGQNLAPTKQNILDGIRNENPRLPISITDFEFKEAPNNRTALLKGQGRFKGQVRVKYDCNNFTEVTDWVETNGVINTLTTDKDSNIYAGTNNGLYKSTNQRNKFSKLANIDDKVWSLVIDKNGTVYVGTKTGNNVGQLYKITNNQVEEVSGWSPNNGEVYCLTTTSDGTIYAGTKTGDNVGQLYKITNNQVEKVSGWSPNNGTILSLTTTSDGNVYIGTRTEKNIKGQLYKITNNQVEKVSGWNPNNGEVYCLTTASDGTIYAGVSKKNKDNNAIIYKITGDTISKITLSNETNGGVWSLTSDFDGNVYAGIVYTNDTTRILKVTSDGTITSPTGLSQPRSAVWSSTVDKNGTVYAGTGYNGINEGTLFKSEKVVN